MCLKLLVCAGMARDETPPRASLLHRELKADAQTPPIGGATKCAIRQKNQTVCHTISPSGETPKRFFIRGSRFLHDSKQTERFGEKALFGLEHNNSLWALFSRVADSRRRVSRRRRAAAW
jgi:hypothetical protein